MLMHLVCITQTKRYKENSPTPASVQLQSVCTFRCGYAFVWIRLVVVLLYHEDTVIILAAVFTQTLVHEYTVMLICTQLRGDWLESSMQ